MKTSHFNVISTGIRVRLRAALVLSALVLICFPVLGRADPVDSNTALLVVRNWLGTTPQRMLQAVGVSPLTVTAVRPFKDKRGKAIAYVVDLSPRGFAIVPADDVLEPVLTFGTEGNWDEGNGPDPVLSAMISQDIPYRLSTRLLMPLQYRQDLAARWARYRSTTPQSGMSLQAITPVVGPLLTDT